MLAAAAIAACVLVVVFARGCGEDSSHELPRSAPEPEPAPRIRTPRAENRASTSLCDEQAHVAVPAAADSPSALDVPLDPAAFPREPPLYRLGRLAGFIPIRILVSENAATLLRVQPPVAPRIVTVSFTGRSALDGLLREWSVQYLLDGDVVRVFLDTEVLGEIVSWEETPVIDEVALLDVWGSVVDRDGFAVADAAIVQLLDQEFARAQSDVAGRFHLRLREPYGALEARVSGRATSPAQPISGAPGATVSLVLAIGGAESKLRVSVVADATPIARALVLICDRAPHEPGQSMREGGRGPRESARRTNRDGEAPFDGLSGGAVTVKVYADGYQPVTREFELESGKDEALVVAMTRREPIADRVRRTKVTLRVVDEKPSDIVETMSRLLEIPIVLSPRVAEATAHRRLSLTEEDNRLEDALTRFCNLLGDCEFEIDEPGHAVVIRPRSNGGK